MHVIWKNQQRIHDLNNCVCTNNNKIGVVSRSDVVEVVDMPYSFNFLSQNKGKAEIKILPHRTLYFDVSNITQV